MNHPVVKLVVVLAVLLGGGFYAMRKVNTTKEEAEHKLGLERIRKEYLERAPMARLMAEPARYEDEQRAVWKWYFNELTDHYNRFPDRKNYERFLDELIEKKTKKKVKEQEFAQYEERYKLVKEYWELMEGGKYMPIFTALDKGLRFDVYEIRPIPDPREPRVRLYFTIHGVQRKWNEEQTGAARIRKLTVNANYGDVQFKGVDEAGKPSVEFKASCEPFSVDNPERFIEEFPPGLVLGYYELPKIPALVAKAELAFEIGTRSVISGEEVMGKFVWNLAPLPSEWRLPASAGWDGAQEQVRGEPEAE
jgi:hypothetical protein